MTWKYPALRPLDIPAGEYTIYVAAADRPGKAHSAGKSGCAWEIHDASGKVIEDSGAILSANSKSLQWRGYIAAATGGVEQLPKNSIATICSHHKTFLSGVEALNENVKRDWMKTNGDPLVGADIWKRLLLARDGTGDDLRHIQINTREIETTHPVLKRLKKRIEIALDQATSKKPPKAE